MIDKIIFILNHIRTNPESRTAKAWELTLRHHHDISPNNNELTAEIYRHAFLKSTIGSRSRIFNSNIFKTSTFKAQDVNNKLAKAIHQQQLTKGTRTYNIIMALGN